MQCASCVCEGKGVRMGAARHGAGCPARRRGATALDCRGRVERRLWCRPQSLELAPACAGGRPPRWSVIRPRAWACGAARSLALAASRPRMHSHAHRAGGACQMPGLSQQPPRPHAHGPPARQLRSGHYQGRGPPAGGWRARRSRMRRAGAPCGDLRAPRLARRARRTTRLSQPGGRFPGCWQPAADRRPPGLGRDCVT